MTQSQLFLLKVRGTLRTNTWLLVLKNLRQQIMNKMRNDFQTANQGCETQLDLMNPADKVSDDIRNEPTPIEEYFQLLITSAWDNDSARMTIFEEWLHFRKEFGPQCPTSPLLPPRKDPLEDLILQLVYRPDPTTSSYMMTSRLLPPSSSTDMMTSRLLNLDFFQSAMLTSSLQLAASSCWYLATAEPSAEYDDVTDDVIIAKPFADLAFLLKALKPAADNNQRTNHLLIIYAPADLSTSAEHDVVTNDIIIDGPLRCSSWFSFDVTADPSPSSSACSWFISFQLIHFAPTGSTWPPPDYEQLIQLWTSPLLIQLPSKCMHQTNC
ncbi:hypothetical protein F511_36516 [Dorcoceras hygrometricum]|uniref:Uncharacterized protein n=1 Tax=Dorcoceras hygrometricum TaxID=472368 RepID=A0A2Z7CI78_9LAMI|nr:hypothetical protein F511_36516 [Dorcoceras hygrometricum]